MKRPEDMTDAELDQFLLAGNAQQKKPEDMSEAELDSYLLSGSSTKAPEKIEVSNEESDIGSLDRVLVKNFGGNIEDQVDYLKKNNPKLEVKNWQGEIIAKKPEETVWKKLDPSGVTSAKEALLDLADVGYDIASGAGSSIAGAAGAVPGALFGFGAGGLATGAAAAGAASGGLELIRQAIGKGLKTRKDISGKEIGVSTLLGGATTGILGAGASKALIAKAASKPEVVTKTLSKIMETVPKDLAEQTKVQLTKDLIEEGQKGILSGAFKNITSKWSGIPKSVLETATKEVPQQTIESLAEAGINLNKAKKYTNLEFADVLEKEGMSDLGKFSAESIMNAIQKAKEETGSKIQNALESTGKTENLGELVKPLQDLSDFFTKEYEKTGSKLNLERAEQVKKYIDQIGTEDRQVSLGSLFNIKNELADIIDYSKSPLAVMKEGAPSGRIRNALIDVEREMNNRIKNALPQFAEAQKEYAQHMDVMRYLAPKFKDADTAIKTLDNVEGLRNPTLKRVLQDFSKKYDVDIMSLADAAETWKYFGRPAREPIVGGGSAKVLRGGGIGASLGYLSGLATGIPGGGAAGAAIGGGLGTLSSSPAAIKQLLKAETAVGRGASGIANQLRSKEIEDIIRRVNEGLPAKEYTQSGLNKQAVGQSVWRMMGGQ